MENNEYRENYGESSFSGTEQSITDTQPVNTDSSPDTDYQDGFDTHSGYSQHHTTYPTQQDFQYTDPYNRAYAQHQQYTTYNQMYGPEVPKGRKKSSAGKKASGS